MVRIGLRELLRRLGVKPVLGRAFARNEYGDRAQAFTAVISYRLWKNYFRADKSVLGRTVQINRYPVTIVGVAPPEFGGDFPGVALDVWVPAPLAGERYRNARHFMAIVRLKPGVSVPEANAEAATVAARLARDFPRSGYSGVRPQNRFISSPRVTKQVTSTLRAAL